MIYLSGPITKPNPMHNTNTAVRIASVLLRNGYTPFVPHLCVLWDTIIPEEYTEWIRYDLRVLESCNVLVRIPGESVGADIEVAHAHLKKMPVIELYSAFPDLWPIECLAAVRDVLKRVYQ